jgi:hypothetical protein
MWTKFSGTAKQRNSNVKLPLLHGFTPGLVELT